MLLVITTLVLCFLLFETMSVLLAYAEKTEETVQPDITSVVYTTDQCPCTPWTQVSAVCCYQFDGGVVVSVNKFDLIAPYVGLALTMIAPTITFVAVKQIKRRRKKH